MFESERLVFHYPEATTCTELAKAMCALENQRLMSPRIPLPLAPDRVLDRVRSNHPAPFTGADQAFELAVSQLSAPDEPIGLAGLYSVDFAHSVAEIGISILRPTAQGQGLGIEAHERWIDYAFHDLGLERLTGTAKASNERALNVAARLGMVREGLLRSHRFVEGRRIDLVLLGLLREEWRRNHPSPNPVE